MKGKIIQSKDCSMEDVLRIADASDLEGLMRRVALLRVTQLRDNIYTADLAFQSKLSRRPRR